MLTEALLPPLKTPQTATSNHRQRPRLSLVIPACNEESQIANTLRGFVNWLTHQEIAHEIWVVVNGCRDNTAQVVQRFCNDHPQVGWVSMGVGDKGKAVRLGLQLSTGEWVGFVDADGQISPQEFGKLLRVLEGQPEMAGAIGSKYAGGSGQHSSKKRLLAGKAFSQLIQRSLGLPFRDTQCGAKVFRNKALSRTLPELNMAGWAFDVELLYQLHHRGHAIAEVPIHILPDSRPSRISLLKAGPKMVGDILRLSLSLQMDLPLLTQAAVGRSWKKLGQILYDLDVISQNELDLILNVQQQRGRGRLGELLVEMKLVQPEFVQFALALQNTHTGLVQVQQPLLAVPA